MAREHERLQARIGSSDLSQECELVDLCEGDVVAVEYVGEGVLEPGVELVEDLPAGL